MTKKEDKDHHASLAAVHPPAPPSQSDQLSHADAVNKALSKLDRVVNMIESRAITHGGATEGLERLYESAKDTLVAAVRADELNRVDTVINVMPLWGNGHYIDVEHFRERLSHLRPEVAPVLPASGYWWGRQALIDIGACGRLMPDGKHACILPLDHDGPCGNHTPPKIDLPPIGSGTPASDAERADPTLRSKAPK